MAPRRKKARVIPPRVVTQNGYRFDLLPNEMKEMVLKKIHPDTAIKLLQLNRYTREWVMRNRSYAERIKIKLYEDNKLTVELHRKFLEEKVAYNWLRRTPIRTTLTLDSRVISFPLVLSCDELVIDFSGPTGSDPPFKLHKLFPNLMFLDTLQVEVTDFEILVSFIEHHKFRSIENFRTNYVWQDHDQVFIDFVRMHLNRCATFCFDGDELNLLEIWDLLKTMKYECLAFCCFWCDTYDPVDFLKMVLEQGGIPSLSPTAKLRCTRRYPEENEDYEEVLYGELFPFMEVMVEYGARKAVKKFGCRYAYRFPLSPTKDLFMGFDSLDSFSFDLVLFSIPKDS